MRGSLSTAGRCSGVYTLLVKVSGFLRAMVGRLGENVFFKGFYAYTGSAFGPGGLRARVSRHLSSRRRLKWHIDYLLSNRQAEVKAVVYACSLRKLECRVSRSLTRRGLVVKGFGSSDCRSECGGHLVYLGDVGVEGAMRVVAEAYKEAGLTPKVFWRAFLQRA